MSHSLFLPIMFNEKFPDVKGKILKYGNMKLRGQGLGIRGKGKILKYGNMKLQR